MEFKIEIMKLGKKQTDVLHELHKKGITCSPQLLSASLLGTMDTPKARFIREETRKIIDNWKG